MNPMHQHHHHHPYYPMGPSAGLGYGPGPQISKMTNSQDPRSKAARVFIGNLNTGQVKEHQVMEIFSNYGSVVGVSLMNGFGFVQFTNEHDAKSAVDAEHGHVIAEQPMDLCIASKPNPSRVKGYKRVNPGYNWQMRSNYGASSYVDPTNLPVIPAANADSPQNKKMRFQSNSNVGKDKISGDEPSSWVCAFCQQESATPWELMKHASLAHQTQIYVANPEYENK